MHDGAAVIRNGRLTSVASFLPLTSQEGLRKEWGTRHRSAIGITERCDAWALVVSEERGDVSLARGGRLSPNAKTVKVELDLAQAETGKNVFFITRKQILLPSDRIDIIRIVPDNLSVELRSKPTE